MFKKIYCILVILGVIFIFSSCQKEQAIKGISDSKPAYIASYVKPENRSTIDRVGYEIVYSVKTTDDKNYIPPWFHDYGKSKNHETKIISGK